MATIPKPRKPRDRTVCINCLFPMHLTREGVYLGIRAREYECHQCGSERTRYYDLEYGRYVESSDYRYELECL